METEANPEIRKAAILINSLDQESARLLLDQLNRQTAKSVLQQVRQLDDVSNREKETVLAEFLKSVQLVSRQKPNENSPTTVIN